MAKADTVSSDTLENEIHSSHGPRPETRHGMDSGPAYNTQFKRDVNNHTTTTQTSAHITWSFFFFSIARNSKSNT